jgi:hypothetical protein
MDRSTGTPVGFALLLLFAVAFGWVSWGAPNHRHDPATAAAFAMYNSPSAMAAAEAQPPLVWPDEMPEPMTNYVGRRVTASDLKVTSADADEGFWVQKGGRRAWVQIEAAAEPPYVVRAGDTVSLTGRVLPHDPNYPNQLVFCPDRQASKRELSRASTHFAVAVDGITFEKG